MEFLTWPIIRYKREVLFGWVDLLVSFGGIAGLFLGFSLLSGVEIIYYFTLRACCMVYRNKAILIEIEEEIRKKPPKPVDLHIFPRKRKSTIKPIMSKEVAPPVINNHGTVRRTRNQKVCQIDLLLNYCKLTCK